MDRTPKKNVQVNLSNCRGELDTLHFVCKELEFRAESKDSEHGNLFWYGVALRDNDMDFLKNKACLINRYPLMDVSNYFSYLFCLALCQEEHLLCYYLSSSKIFPTGIQLHAAQLLATRRDSGARSPHEVPPQPDLHLQAVTRSRRRRHNFD